MPPAALIPAVLGVAGMVDANVQNKATIKNAENAQTAAQAGAKQNQQAALGNLSAFNQQNPGPVQGGGVGQAKYSGSAIPLAGAGAQVQAPQAGGGQSQMNPQMIAQLLQHLQSGGAGTGMA